MRHSQDEKRAVNQAFYIQWLSQDWTVVFYPLLMKMPIGTLQYLDEVIDMVAKGCKNQ